MGASPATKQFQNRTNDFGIVDPSYNTLQSQKRFGDSNPTDSGQIIGFKVGALRKALKVHRGAFVRMIPLWIINGHTHGTHGIGLFNIIDEVKSQD